MSSIEFEEPSISLRTIDISNAVSHNTPLLIRYRIVRDLETANKAMWMIFLFLVLCSIGVYVFRPTAAGKVYKEDFTVTELRHMLPNMVDNLPSKPR